MREQVRNLAESILDLRVINKYDLEQMIEVYFKIWQKEQLAINESNNPTFKLRAELESNKDSLFFKKVSLENQLEKAKLAKSNKTKIDENWYIRTQAALKITNYQYEQAKAELGMVKQLKKIDRMRVRDTEQQIFSDYLGDLIAAEFGVAKRKELCIKADSLTKANLELTGKK